MKSATVQSRCECQAVLGAELDERRCVVRGWAKDPTRKREYPAPATVIHPERSTFDVGWFCPVCIRNTLRSFDASGLHWKEKPEASAPAAP